MDSVAWTAGEGGTTAQITGFAEDIVDKSAISDAIAATADGINTSAPEIEFSRIPVQNWVAENIQQFPPIIAGRFFVHGSEYQKPVPPHKSRCVCLQVLHLGPGIMDQQKDVCLLLISCKENGFKTLSIWVVVPAY